MSDGETVWLYEYLMQCLVCTMRSCTEPLVLSDRLTYTAIMCADLGDVGCFVVDASVFGVL